MIPVRLRFDLSLTSKILNLSFLRFNEQSEFQNHAYLHKAGLEDISPQKHKVVFITHTLLYTNLYTHSSHDFDANFVCVQLYGCVKEYVYNNN